jgi:hypothetical protein
MSPAIAISSAALVSMRTPSRTIADDEGRQVAAQLSATPVTTHLLGQCFDSHVEICPHTFTASGADLLGVPLVDLRRRVAVVVPDDHGPNIVFCHVG